MLVEENQPEVELWRAYAETGCATARSRLLAQYTPIVRTIAARLYRLRSHDQLSYGDYVQYGHVGLLEAVERYDCAREASFQAFSALRIRGSILDGIACNSEQAAQLRFWRRRGEQRVASLWTACASNADRLSLADIASITAGLAVGVLLEDVEGNVEVVDHNPRRDPYTVNEVRQLRVAARRLLVTLPDRERVILEGHYLEGADFESLALRLKLSKGRISQIHAQALLRMRASLMGPARLDKKV